MGIKKIVIISSGQPSANPRMVKNAIALSKAGFNITVIYCPLSPWADFLDKELFQMNAEIKWVRVGYHPVDNKWKYLYARIRQKCYQFIYKCVGNIFDAAICSMVLFNQELTQEAKKHKCCLYIGHNLGALPAVVKGALHNNVFVSFDFEDFHRGEDSQDSLQWKKTKQVEDMYVPLLTFVTAASPLISKEYKRIFPSISITTINNCFPRTYSINDLIMLPIQPLKLFWFSQMIGGKRGLETVIEAMGKMGKGKVELSLLGNCSDETKSYFKRLAKNNRLENDQLKFLHVIEERKIPEIAAMHHIGLACEVTLNLNRQLCLTNKIFMYLLAGNAIVFSNTLAQSLFLEEHPEIGVVYEQDNAGQLAGLLSKYIECPQVLHRQRIKSLNLGNTYMNWDIENRALLDKVKVLLQA